MCPQTHMQLHKTYHTLIPTYLDHVHAPNKTQHSENSAVSYVYILWLHMSTQEYSHGHLDSSRHCILTLFVLRLKFSFLGGPQTHQDASGVEHPKEREASSPFPHVSFPFHPVHDPKRSVSSVHTEEETVMKIYYMRVQTKRGVAVLYDSEEELEPPSKKTKIEEMTIPETIQAEIPPSQAGTRDLLTESEWSWNNEAQEESEELDSSPEPHVVEEYPRIKTPEWLVAPDKGFKCMACCRVFPSLEILREHVRHGVKEGFSCYTFHLALTCLEKMKSNEKGRQAKNNKKTTCECQKEKHFGMKLSSCK